MPSDLEKVLEWIQPDILRIEQGRLRAPYCDHLQIQTEESALAILDGKPHVIVCVKNPEYSEKDFLLVSYTVDSEGFSSIVQEQFLTPDQVVFLKQKGIIQIHTNH